MNIRHILGLALGLAVLACESLCSAQGATPAVNVAPASRPVGDGPATRAVAPFLLPQGPSVKVIRVSGDGVTTGPSNDNGNNPGFGVRFPEGDGSPLVVDLEPTDISGRLGMAMDIQNTGQAPARIFADLNGDNWVRGYVIVPPGQTGTLYVFERRKKLAAGDAERFPGMHGIPGGKMSLWAGIEEPVVAKDLKIFVVRPAAEITVRVGNVRPFGSSQIPDPKDFYPFIDKYGQYKHAEWPGKIHADGDLKANAEREVADLATHPGPTDVDQYGGWAGGPQLKATGHFRTEKYDGQWWLVDPEGRLFWSHGLDCVGFFLSSTRTQGRERFFDDPAPMGNFLSRNLETKYGTEWRGQIDARLLQRLHSWGINTLSGFSEPGLVQSHKIPYTLQISTGRRSGIDPRSDAWLSGARRVLSAAAQNSKNDPWCLGVFVDNEIHASSDPAWFEMYYAKVGGLMKELMPDTLYLGSRLDYHNWPDEPRARHEIVRAAARHCDVVSFNFYKFTLDDMMMPDGIDMPVIIGEFHFGALDRGLFHTGLRSVVDQEQRGEAYREYVQSALRSPTIVGAHWFQAYDEAATGRFDGENYQIGFMDTCDTPYAETIAAVRDVGYKLYELRRRSGPATRGK